MARHRARIGTSGLDAETGTVAARTDRALRTALTPAESDVSLQVLRHRARSFALALITMHFVIPTVTTAAESAAAPSSATQAAGPSVHDFDFLVGRWTVQHRRLKHRLAHSNEWETFSGTCETKLLLGGQADVDDNILEVPGGGLYRAATMRVFDPSLAASVLARRRRYLGDELGHGVQAHIGLMHAAPMASISMRWLKCPCCLNAAGVLLAAPSGGT